MSRFTFALLLLPCAWNLATAAENSKPWELKVEGTDRQFLVYFPANAKTASCPVVFAYHGHGGTMQNTAKVWNLQQCWPEAIIVYPQGVNTPGVVLDPEGKRPGWQKAVGEQNDRDLKFFDAMLAALQKEYQVDAKRIYATGHSNGGAFLYALWAARGDALAAVAPCAGAEKQAPQKLAPKPVILITGQKDPLVKIEEQKETIAMLRKLNGCEDGKPWHDTPCIEYPSKTGTPLVTYVHAGPHGLPKDAFPLIVLTFA